MYVYKHRYMLNIHSTPTYIRVLAPIGHKKYLLE